MHRKNITDSSSSYLGLRSSKSNNLNTAASNKQLLSSRNAVSSSSRQQSGSSQMNINEQSVDNKENINSSNLRYLDRNNIFKSSNFPLDAHSITIIDRKGDNLNQQQQETFRKHIKQTSPLGIEGYMNSQHIQDQRSKQQQQHQNNSNIDNRRIESQQWQQQQKITSKNAEFSRINTNSSTDRRIHNQNVNFNQQELPQREYQTVGRQAIQKQSQESIQDKVCYSLMPEQQQQQQTQSSFKNLYQEILSSCGVRQPTKESRKSLNKSMQSNCDEQSFCKAETDSASRSFSKVDSDSINISALLNSNGQFGSIIPDSYFTNETLIGRQRALSSMDYQDSQQQGKRSLIASNGCLKNSNVPVPDKQLMDEVFQNSQSSRNRNPSVQNAQINTPGNSNSLSSSYSQAHSVKQKIAPTTIATKSPQNSHFRSQNHEIVQEEQQPYNYSNSLESQMLISRQNEINTLRKELRISNHELLGSRSKVKTLEQEIKTLKTQMEQDKKQKQSGEEVIQKIKGLQFIAAQEKRISTRIITDTYQRNEKIALVLQNLMKIISIIQEKIQFSKQSPERILGQIGDNLQPILQCILPVIDDINEFNKQTFNLHGNQLGLKSNNNSQQQQFPHEESSKVKHKKTSRDNYQKSEVVTTAKTLKQSQKQQQFSNYQRQQVNKKGIKPQQSSNQLLMENCANKKTIQLGKQFRSISFDDMDYDEYHLKNDISDNELRQSVSSVNFQRQGVTNDKKNMNTRKYFQPINHFENINMFKNSINEEKEDGNKFCRQEDLSSKNRLGCQISSNTDQAGEFFQSQMSSHRKILTEEFAIQKQSEIAMMLEESDFPNYQERKDQSCDSIQEQQGEYDEDEEKQSSQVYQMACSSEKLFNNTLKGLKETLRNLTLDDVSPDTKNLLKQINKEEEQYRAYDNKSFREDANCFNSYDVAKEESSQSHSRESIKKLTKENLLQFSQQKSNQKAQNNDKINNSRILSQEEEDFNTFRTIEEGIIGISADPDTERNCKLPSNCSEKSTTQQEIDILKQRIAQRQSRRKLQGNLNKSSLSIHGTSISATSFRDLSSPQLS